MNEQDKQKLLDTVADTIEALITDGMGYVVLLTEPDTDGTMFATCTNMGESGTLYAAQCLAKDMEFALMKKGAVQ